MGDRPDIETLQTGDVLILGAGLAGLFAALQLAPRRCVVISPTRLGTNSSSAWAQGGLAAALSPQDNPEQHARDTIRAGAGLVDPAIALMFATEGPSRVRELLELGVPFDRSESGELQLALEAAHSFPRVARVKGDLAGREIMNALIRATHMSDHILIKENFRADRLLINEAGECCGTMVSSLDRTMNIVADHTILATGGSGGLFQVTTNPKSSRGEGLGMAAQIGAELADLEFVQFHPTAMNVGRDPAPLATEALRGEGAHLVNKLGARFCFEHHKDGEMAPRDIVARAIAIELQQGREPMLDTRPAVGDHIETQFPTVYGAAMASGFDLKKRPVPVAPAAHYHCGGIVTDEWANSSIPRLSVIGESACTGLHGANRLASNSLLEAVIFGGRCATKIKETALEQVYPAIATAEKPADQLLPASFRALTSNYLGVYRTQSGFDILRQEIEKFESEEGVSFLHASQLWMTTLKMIVIAAMSRKENCGTHYVQDFPAGTSDQYRQILSADEASDNAIIRKMPVPESPSWLTNLEKRRSAKAPSK